ncbi:hypothetical protein DFP73DRAFT_167314 [Morchella snyderi]|nr:hypothetical protein DFP73DRAFT_167314 [Morchella snyderi]
MSFAKSISGAALAIVLLQGAMGNPVSKTTSVYASSISSPTPSSTTVGYEGQWDACDNTPAPYGCPSSSSTSACPSICADYINECGMMYGGCFSDPKCTGGTAWPTFSKPPCPTASPTSSVCPTICADYINDCGQMYGGCFPDPQCTGGTAFPSFSKPPCPTTTTTPPPTITTVPGSTTTCSTFICSDFINSCGRIEGVCLLDPYCTHNGVFPTTYSLGPCTTTTETYTPTQACNTICVDKINGCGQKYGGCFPDPTCTGGTAWPTFSSPACPTAAGSTSVSVTTITPAASPSTTLETDTVTSYTSIAPDTVTVTSTSQTVIIPSSSVAAVAAGNETHSSGVSPTTSEPAPQPIYTGEAMRSRMGCGIVVVVMAIAVAFL